MFHAVRVAYHRSVPTALFLLAVFLFAGCDDVRQPPYSLAATNPPPAPKIAVGQFDYYPTPGFPANSRELLVDALRYRLQEQGMLWSDASDPRIDLSGNLQVYDGRYASPAEESLVIDLTGELREGTRLLTKSHVSSRIQRDSDWTAAMNGLAEQLLDDLRNRSSIPPSTGDVAGANGYSTYPAYGGSYAASPYYANPYGSYYYSQPYYYGYGPAYVNLYWLSRSWSGHHHDHGDYHHDRDPHRPPDHGRPPPRPLPIPPSVLQSVPSSHPGDHIRGAAPTGGRAFVDPLRQPRDEPQNSPRDSSDSERPPQPDRPEYRPTPWVTSVPQSMRPREVPRDFGISPRMDRNARPQPAPVARMPIAPLAPQTQNLPRPAPIFTAPSPQRGIPRSAPVMPSVRVAPPTFSAPHVPSRPVPAMPVAPPRPPAALPSGPRGGGFGAFAPGSQRRRR